MNVLLPDWRAPRGVRAFSTTRAGGVSEGPWRSLNLGDHVGDDPANVAENRARLRSVLPADPVWLKQVHGTRCIVADSAPRDAVADAAVTRAPNVVCAVLTADCLPVLLCDDEASVVGIAHAGWRGLAAGVIEATVAEMATSGECLMAWLGPAIGPTAFEVGDEVRAAFIAGDAEAEFAFAAHGKGKWLCDIYSLAARRLASLGVRRVTRPDFCTVSDAARFFSYRRDGASGRMASLIWLEPGV